MDMSDIPTAAKSGPFTRLLIKIAGVDEETLRQCPPADADNVKAVAAIMICTWLYQAALFALIGHRLFAGPGELRPDLVLASGFIATFILLIDSYMVMRSGWYSQGLQELKRGGLDISGGWAARLKASIFLTIRILLSAGIAQLTAIFLSLMIFGSDVAAQLHATYLQANAELLTNVTALVDRDIQRATEAADAEAARYAAMAGQVATLRQNQIDPAAGDTQVQQAQKELNDRLAEKATADGAVVAAETFSTNELGGVKGAPQNSGQVGDGTRHKAALERVAEARAHAAAVGGEVSAARARLDAVHQRHGIANLSTKQLSKEQLPGFEKSLAVEETKLTATRDHLATLTDGRDETMRKALEQSPGYVPPDTGLLAQITALERVAGDDPKIKTIIILIDLVSFGFELSAVLAKVTSYVPTTYAALLASESYLQVVRIVDQLMQKLDHGAQQDNAEIIAPDAGEGDDEAAGQAPDRRSIFPVLTPDPFGAAADAAPRRPRGRPRKPQGNGVN